PLVNRDNKCWSLFARIGAGLNYVRDFVRDCSAVVLGEGKAYLIESRLSAIARREGAGSVSELVNRLERQPCGRMHDEVVPAMITKETSWFRDLHPFHALRDHVLPPLVAARAPKETITIWCAAC